MRLLATDTLLRACLSTYVLIGSLGLSVGFEATADVRLVESLLFKTVLALDKNLLKRFFSFSSFATPTAPGPGVGLELMLKAMISVSLSNG
jgi:hypothetical protein